jgi:hypothetical protein
VTRLAAVAAAAVLVLPVVGAGADDAGVRQNVEAALLAQAAALAGATVRVEARDGDVLLHGTVRFYRQRLLVEQLAWRTAGVREVENEVRVEPLAPVADAEIERQIIALAKAERLQGAELVARVVDGAVAVSATFHDPADVFFLRRHIAAIEGVRALTIAARFAV